MSCPALVAARATRVDVRCRPGTRIARTTTVDPPLPPAIRYTVAYSKRHTTNHSTTWSERVAERLGDARARYVRRFTLLRVITLPVYRARARHATVAVYHTHVSSGHDGTVVITSARARPNAMGRTQRARKVNTTSGAVRQPMVSAAGRFRSISTADGHTGTSAGSLFSFTERDFRGVRQFYHGRRLRVRAWRKRSLGGWAAYVRGERINQR